MAQLAGRNADADASETGAVLGTATEVAVLESAIMLPNDQAVATITKRTSSGLAIPRSLDGAQRLVEAAKASGAAAAVAAEMQASTAIEPATFYAELEALMKVTAAKRPSLHAAFNSADMSFEHTTWRLKVGSAVTQQVLLEAKPGLLQYLMGKLSHPNLSMEIVLDETVNVQPAQPTVLQGSQLLDAMAERNPHVYELVQRFGGMIEY